MLEPAPVAAPVLLSPAEQLLAGLDLSQPGAAVKVVAAAWSPV